MLAAPRHSTHRRGRTLATTALRSGITPMWWPSGGPRHTRSAACGSCSSSSSAPSDGPSRQARPRRTGGTAARTRPVSGPSVRVSRRSSYAHTGACSVRSAEPPASACLAAAARRRVRRASARPDRLAPLHVRRFVVGYCLSAMQAAGGSAICWGRLRASRAAQVRAPLLPILPVYNALEHGVGFCFALVVAARSSARSCDGFGASWRWWARCGDRDRKVQIKNGSPNNTVSRQ